jgi:PIN domain nuclease of toxin-antitoxin system
MSFVLDASAVLAVLLDEPGGDFVFDVINGSHISVVNLSEVYATLMDGGMTFEAVQQVVEPLPMNLWRRPCMADRKASLAHQKIWPVAWGSCVHYHGNIWVFTYLNIRPTNGRG